MTAVTYTRTGKNFFYYLSFSGHSKKRDHCLKEDLYPLVESEPCDCDAFISEPWGNWSVCILPNDPPLLSPHGWRGEKEVRECGEGKRYRAMACLDQMGRLLDPSHCAETGESDPFRNLGYSLLNFRNNRNIIHTYILVHWLKCLPLLLTLIF